MLNVGKSLGSVAEKKGERPHGEDKGDSSEQESDHSSDQENEQERSFDETSDSVDGSPSTSTFLSRYEDLISAGLSKRSLAKIAAEPSLGSQFAEILRDIIHDRDDSQVQLANANRTIHALRQIVKSMSGWTEKYLDQCIADAIEVAETADAASEGPMMDHSVTSNSALLNSSMVVSNAAPLRISSISMEQMFRFSEYLRQCIAEGVEDKRAAVLSQEATVQLHRAFLTRSGGRVPKGAKPQLWLAWPTERLALAVEYTFPRAGQTSLDWLAAFDKLFVELDVTDQSSYSGYLNDITKTELSSQHRITPESQVVKALVNNLSKPPDRSAQVTQCNRQMHLELKRLLDEKLLPTIEDYIIEFGGTVDRAEKVLQKAALWKNSHEDLSMTGKRPVDHAHGQQAGKLQRMEHGTCQGCGVVLPAYIDPHKTYQECRRCIGHPDRNIEGSWTKSYIRTVLASKGYPCLSRKHFAEGGMLPPHILEAMELARLRLPQPPAQGQSSQQNGPAGRGHSGRGGRGSGGRGPGRGSF